MVKRSNSTGVIGQYFDNDTHYLLHSSPIFQPGLGTGFGWVSEVNLIFSVEKYKSSAFLFFFIHLDVVHIHTMSIL